MGLYRKYILPKIIHYTCKQPPNQNQRKKIVPRAYGNVLEIGIGSGHNLPFYDGSKVNSVTGIDPAEKVWQQGRIDIDALPFAFNFIRCSAEKIPLDNKQFDTVLVTYSLCTIPDLPSTFSELRRLLKPSGQLVFCEHGLSHDRHIARLQNTLNPIWRFVSGGCNLNRNIPKLIEDNGFDIQALETMYTSTWKLGSFNFWGNAKVS